LGELELVVDELVVVAVEGYELLVGALLYYMAFAEHYDIVGVLDGG